MRDVNLVAHRGRICGLERRRDDGRIDLVYNCAGSGKIYLLRNLGSRSEPVFDLPREFRSYGEEIAFTIHGPNAWPGDLNGDGKPDLLGCVEWSVYPFYAYAALEMDEHPEYEIGKLERLPNRTSLADQKDGL